MDALIAEVGSQADGQPGMIDEQEDLDPRLQMLAQQQMAAMKKYQSKPSEPSPGKKLTLPRPDQLSAAKPIAPNNQLATKPPAPPTVTIPTPTPPATTTNATVANATPAASSGVRQASAVAPMVPESAVQTANNPIQQTLATSAPGPAVGTIVHASGTQPVAQAADAGEVPSGDAQANQTTTIELASHSASAGDTSPVAPTSAREHLEALISFYESEDAASDSPQGLQRLTKLRLLHLLADDPDEAMRKVSDLSAPEQDYLRYQMMTLWTMIDPEGSPSKTRRWEKSLENLRLAIGHLAASTESLDVAGMAFCTEVESFGRIKPFKDYKLQAGQQVILYCEIDNFAAERLSDGYETHFQGSYDIFDSQGIRVAEQVLPADKQSCNNFRRDYFIAYRMYLPKQLKPGPHRVQLTIEDLKGKKFGQASLDFEVVAESKQSAED